MAAQQDNSSVNAGVVAQDPSLMPTASVPTADPTATLDPNRGQQISGPALPVEPVPEITPDPVVQEPTVDQPAVEQPVEEKKSKKRGNPLQALADKLSELKSELIEEKSDASASPQPSPVLPETDPVEAPSEPSEPIMEQPMDEIPSAASQPLASEPAAETVLQDMPSPLEPTDIPKNPETVIPATMPKSSLDDIMPASPIAQQEEAPLPPTEPIVPVTEEMKEELPGVSLEEAKKEETLEEEIINTGPEALLGIDTSSQEPASADSMPSSPTPPSMSEQGPDKVIDENDSSSVTTEQVKATSGKGGKYPLSITKVLDIAIERNASDIQISVGYPVMIRIDGTLIAVNEQIVSDSNAEELIMPVLSEQKKELLEVNREVDLAYTHQNGTNARFRINAYYSRQNLTAAFRHIPSRIKTIEELQLPAIYNQFANMKQGFVLVTGPTGHGKSTTLAAILQSVNTNRAVHILTIEDPIEYIFPQGKAVVDQREMHDDTHSWTIALKSALRQDPDVILVGEMRDYETIAAAITLAETGHLVFATLHTNSASQTLDRIIDVFPENQQAQIRTQLANILEAVVAQRLVPIEGGGRRAVSEIMLGTPAVRNLIREGKTHQIDNVIRTSADVGMVSLEHSLVKLVRDGLITMDKAQEYAVHPEEVVRLLKG